MSFSKELGRKWLLGLAHGAGFSMAVGVFAVVALSFKGDLAGKVRNYISPVSSSGAEFDLSSYKSANKLINHHLAYIDGRDQIKVPDSYTKHYINSTERFLKVFANTQGNAAFFFADGEYAFKRPIIVAKPNILLLSQSADPSKVVFSGRGMKRSHKVENLIEVKGNGFVLDGITLQKAGNHLIQIRSELDTDFPIVRNCILQDGYEQLIKVSYDKRNKPDNYSDSGLVENCIFRYTAGIGPNYYIGGIDAHGIRNWVIRDNVFKDIASPGKRIAEHAIHLWNNTENNLVEHNIIIDSDRGIGFGMWKKPKNNEHRNIKFSNYGGVIRNNIIYHADNNDPFADTGIVIENSPRTKIENNYVFLEHGYRRAIEYRFPQTQEVIIRGNKVNKNISSRNRGQATKTNNSEELTKVDFMVALNTMLDERNLSIDF